MLRRCLALTIFAMTLGCGPASGGLPTEEAGASGFRAIHIVRDGVPLEPVVRAGALGVVPLDVVLEDADGVFHPRGNRRVTWGSTNPAVADGGDQPGTTFIRLSGDGEAKVIAHFDGLRDTVTFRIAQVVALGTLVTDTAVTLSADARDLSGAASAYHGFRYATIRVDSNGYVVDSREPLRFEVVPQGLVEIVPESVGDTVAILGAHAGAGVILTWFREVADTVPVQVANAYRVIRLIQTPSGALRTLPDTVRIPSGAAVVFQNETPGTLLVESLVAPGWRVGWLRPNGRQAQTFTRVGNHDFFWFGGAGTVIVTP